MDLFRVMVCCQVGRSGEGAIEAWMKSEGHRRNLLNEQHRRIGVGRYERMFTQMFGT